MATQSDWASHEDPVREFVEEVLRTGLMLTDLLSGVLEDLPEDAFPGEEPGEVLIEMLAGTVRPVAEAVGISSVEQATVLLGAMADRTLEDLRTARDLARAGRDQVLRCDAHDRTRGSP